MAAIDHSLIALATQRYKLCENPQQRLRQMGQRLGSGTGSSLEFHDFRSYQPGDDVARIDWSVYARSDQLLLRRHRKEVHPCIDIVLDCSASMQFTDEKSQRALFFAAFCMELAERDGMSAQLWLAQDQFKKCPPRFWRNSLEDCTFQGSIGLRSRGFQGRAGSRRIIISDILYKEGPNNILRTFLNQSSDVSLIHLLSHTEYDPGSIGYVRLNDVEGSSRDVHIDEECRRDYQGRLQRHIQQWKHALRSRGAGLVSLRVEDSHETQFQQLCQQAILALRGIG